MQTRQDFPAHHHARLAGALYAVIIVVGVLGQVFVRDRLVVAGDAAATAANIIASQALWRASVSAELSYLALAIVVDVLLYLLLRPVDRTLALVALLTNVVSIAVEVVGRFTLLVPLIVLGDAPYLAAIPMPQRQAAAYLFVRLHDYGFALSLIFFGVVCLAWGGLIRRSTFVPPILGWLLQLAGACYVVNSFAMLLHPPLAHVLFPWILLPPFVGETALCLWLIFRGVDETNWRATALAAQGG